MNDFAYDVFLSHNAQDKPRVRRLAEKLKQAGLRVWFDEWNVQLGDDIYLSVERGLQDSRTLILCLSPRALGSDYVSLERSTVLFRDPTNTDRRFLPLLLEDCELPDTLRRYKYLDYQQEIEAAFAELLTAVRPDGLLDQGAGDKQQSGAKAREPDPDAPRAVLERQLIGHTGWVTSVAISPDGQWAASGSGDKTVRSWWLEDGACRAVLKGHTGSVMSVAITPDGRWILSGSSDGAVRVWAADTGQERVILTGHTGQVWSVTVLADGVRAISGSEDGSIRIWDLESGQSINAISCGSSVFSAAVNAQMTQVLSGHEDGRIRVWDLATSKNLADLIGHADTVRSLQITPDGRFVVSGSDDRTIKVWDLSAMCCLTTLEGHRDIVPSIALSPDSSLIASTGFGDGTVRLWDRQSGACLQVIDIKASPISVAFSPDGSQLLVGIANTPIHVYGLRLTAAAPIAVRRYLNAKVVLIGEGAVGKTSLAHRLIDDQFVLCERTHGMNVWPLTLPMETADSGFDDREALLWDLAGQEDYRLIHRLFLNETALALLLINPQKEDPFAEVGDWLRALETAQKQAGSSPAARLLVFSQVDVGGIKVSNARIERFCQEHGFQGWLATSAKSGENCSDGQSGGPSPLKRRIADSIPWVRLHGTNTPRLLRTLKNGLMAMRDQADIRLLRFAELVQRLKGLLPGVRFTEAEARTAVTLLANHGLVQPLKFGDLVLLRPELLNGYASAVIRAARAHTDEMGCVAEADIYQPMFDFTGIERLARPDEELLLRALVETFLAHSLCIAEDTGAGRQLVFPSQYRREKAIPWEPDVFVSYTFRGEWQTVWTTLVVRLCTARSSTAKSCGAMPSSSSPAVGICWGSRSITTRVRGRRPSACSSTRRRRMN
uniref:WD40 repeat n=1 Tax=Candidatus Kentrum sp. MB TaxID=2138164 RepID=A0A451B8E3_9GAMM|nr:MAG: WD40 repeat [Candidatus Kentron sp. MB]VFK26571.1 MAG: WD40 repeat [Candidatus Kentron sp. MB]VFK74542.1 MAG: WD40 repeat [Candidatus Kentron sp. MB]